MKKQLKGIALIIFGILLVVIGIAVAPVFFLPFASAMAVFGGLIGIVGLVLACVDDKEEK